MKKAYWLLPFLVFGVFIYFYFEHAAEVKIEDQKKQEKVELDRKKREEDRNAEAARVKALNVQIRAENERIKKEKQDKINAEKARKDDLDNQFFRANREAARLVSLVDTLKGNLEQDMASLKATEERITKLRSEKAAIQELTAKTLANEATILSALKKVEAAEKAAAEAAKEAAKKKSS